MMGVSYESFISVQTENAKLKTINAELLEALGKALNERIGMFDDPADDWLCLDLSFAIHKAKEERC